MENNLYVGNLSNDVTEGDLIGLFEEYGSVSKCHLVLDKFTQESRGFAFIEMASEEQAKAAITGLDGKEFIDRILKVNPARPQA
jgi:RNA recognition motif-containing protein